MNTKHVLLSSVTPMIPTGGSLAEALAFYVGELGFSVQWQSDTMAGIQRDAVAFNLIENHTRAWIENSSYSIGVSDLDGLYQQYRGTTAQVSPPEIKAWGRREFHMIVPQGVCLQFYQSQGEPVL
jgi:hypothetical protein